MENKDIKILSGVALVTAGLYLAYKTRNEKKETKQEISETRGGTIPYKTIGILAALGGLILILKKD
jgi:flagellar motor component MotA